MSSQSTIAQGSSLIILLSPASPGAVSFPGSPSPKAPAGGGARRAGDGLGVLPGAAPAPPPRGLFGERGLGRGGVNRTYTWHLRLANGAGGNEHVHTPENGGLGIG
jgi:hypothetical protein